MLHPQNPTIAVIIPVWRGGHNFRQCLLSLTESSPSPDEIIVVLDGIDEYAKRFSEKLGAEVLVIPEPRGPAAARNAGACIATSSILFFIDSDVIVPPDIVAKVGRIFKNNPQIDAVFGSYDDEPTITSFFSQYKNLFHHFSHQSAREDASTFWAGCGAMRRERFIQLGGFDERYRFPSIEDIELGYRLKEASGQIRLDKNLKVKHLKHWNFLSLISTDFYRRAIPWSDLILRRGFVNDLNITSSGRFSVFLSWAFLLFAITSIWIHFLLFLALFSGMLIIWLNRSFYRFLCQKKGFFFTARAFPFHWLYFVYSGLAFAISVCRFAFNFKLSLKNIDKASSKSQQCFPEE